MALCLLQAHKTSLFESDDNRKAVGDNQIASGPSHPLCSSAHHTTFSALVHLPPFSVLLYTVTLPTPLYFSWTSILSGIKSSKIEKGRYGCKRWMWTECKRARIDVKGLKRSVQGRPTQRFLGNFLWETQNFSRLTSLCSNSTTSLTFNQTGQLLQWALFVSVFV